ncbi:hypothetical protein D9615_010165 [Tricholomella constricta]|uniref:DUF6697 domain-containing protein n=1 Tax=Tricholomella constricta TaxID=117010 RepID=A0A8H5GRI5_9AGAR|nr:hypothetical protein D9615_010165 [Tricholomella constricta]
MTVTDVRRFTNVRRAREAIKSYLVIFFYSPTSFMSTNSDSELASDVLRIFGRELRTAERRIAELQHEASKKCSHSEEAARSVKLEEENAFLHRQLANVDKAFEVEKKRAEMAESTLERLDTSPRKIGACNVAKKEEANEAITITADGQAPELTEVHDNPRTNMTVVSEDNEKLRRQLRELESASASLEMRLAQAEAYKKRMDHKEAEHLSRIAFLEGHLTETAEKINQLRNAQTTFQQEREQIQGAYNELENRLKDVVAEHEAALAALRTDYSHREEVKALEVRLGTMKEKRNGQREARLKLRETYQELEARLQTANEDKLAKEKELKSQVASHRETEARLRDLEAERDCLLLAQSTQVDNIQALESKLEKQVAKRRNQKESLRDLEAERDSLLLAQSTQVENIQALENKLEKQVAKRRNQKEKDIGLRDELKRMEEEVEALKVKGPGIPRQESKWARLLHHTFHTSPAFKNFMRALSIPKIRPDRSFLMPIGETDIDLSSLLCSETTLKQHSANFVKFDGKLITWYNSCHGFVFGPSLPHEMSEGKVWTPSLQFTSLSGQAKEIFFNDGSKVFYAGTYRCLPASEWSEEGCLCPSNSPVLSAIMDTPRPPQNAIENFGGKRVAQMYRNGTLRLDCLILQCVGFDHALYNRMLQITKQPPSLKRKRDVAEAPYSKRVEAATKVSLNNRADRRT